MTKRLDLSNYHNVGNIWLRVSNYGFFGSGNEAYPSLEYPGGSGVDYIFQGALWFGAKKYRRDEAGRQLYWKAHIPSADSTQTIAAGTPEWQPWMKPVVDTLVTVGTDGDIGLFEFLPAYNPLVAGNTDVVDLYEGYNGLDRMATASVRRQKRAEDDDGDGIIDEDFVGFTFPLRVASQLPAQFRVFGEQFIANTDNYEIIGDGTNSEIWFPLGFMDLSHSGFLTYSFAEPYDDDGDGRLDEDGAPVSEQDFIAYYYDYCPFGTPGNRDLGPGRSISDHLPLKVRVRQMSYQWSYDYIKNLVYVEFDITNMNIATGDTLFDCTMGIFMDSDCGPQTMGSEKAMDDLSGYVKGENYEFAYTCDGDGDGGLTPGLIGARVCTPDPEQLKFHCWYWEGLDGPVDTDPVSFNYAPRRTANEKYWLLTGRNPDETRFQPLRPELDDQFEYLQPTPTDTRFLFAFYGAQPGSPEYNETQDGVYYKRWNLAPGRMMKIVVGIFPGDDKTDLKHSAHWAKDIYGKAQTLTTVVLPDTFPHYNPPEPPAIPKLFAELTDDGKRLDLYWDNRSEFSYDPNTISSSYIGWQDPTQPGYIPGIDSDPEWVDWSAYPIQFQPPADLSARNMDARLNPYTAFRLRHDFQGYSIWGRSGSGSQEDWVLVEKWDKIESPQDWVDYAVNSDCPGADTLFIDYCGYTGIDRGLPNPNAWQATGQYGRFYRLDDNYALEQNPSGEFWGFPIYDPDVDCCEDILLQASEIAETHAGLPEEEILRLQARLFMHPEMRSEIYDALSDTRMIPLPGHGGQVWIDNPDGLEELRQERLARRYYTASIHYPRRGVEYYVAATAYDRGIPSHNVNFLETGRDADANMQVFFPGACAKEDMKDIYVVPNPYLGRSSFDGRRPNDNNGDKSRRLWFVNLPRECVIRIYTLAGDLVKEIEHDGSYAADIITVSKAAQAGIVAAGMHDWDLLSRHRQIIAPGVYLYSVENRSDSRISVGKFVIIK